MSTRVSKAAKGAQSLTARDTRWLTSLNFSDDVVYL